MTEISFLFLLVCTQRVCA